jgi:cGMP-dependent protein kinase
MEEMGEQEEIMRLNEIRLRVRDEGIEPLRRAKSETDKTFILSCLKNHFIFYNLSDRELDNVKEHMFWAEMQENTVIFRQGTIGSCFYIIQNGSVEIRADE